MTSPSFAGPVKTNTSAAYARSLLGLLFTINLLNYIDRLVISGLLEPIRKDLGLNDAQLGIIGLAFLLPYSLLPPIVGWIGDRAKRTKLISAAISVWSLATGIAGLAHGFIQLALTRAVVGVGEATYMTVAPSLIADCYPAGQRGTAMSLFYIASPVGAGLGVLLGGMVAAAYGWRTACLLVGLPGILMAVVIAVVPEPDRGTLDPGQEAHRPALGTAARQLLRNKAFLLLAAAYTVQSFAYNPIEFWLPTILQRDKGIPLAQASTAYGTIVFVAGVIGPFLGGLAGDLLVKRFKGAYYYLCAAAAVASVTPLVLIAIQERGTTLFSAAFFEIFFGNISTGLVFAILVTVVIPGLRGTATAVMLTVMHLLGDGISQPLIGHISTWLNSDSPLATATKSLGAAVHIPAQHHLSLALVCVTLPAFLLASLLYVAPLFLGVPGGHQARATSGSSAKAV